MKVGTGPGGWSLRSLLSCLGSSRRPSGPALAQARLFRPGIERIEDRIVPTAPAVLQVLPSVPLIADAQVGTGFQLRIVYDQTLDDTVEPTITFPVENPLITLAGAPVFTIDTTNVTNDTWVATFAVSDPPSGQTLNNVDVRVNDAANPGAEVQTIADTVANVFDIDTHNPAVVGAPSVPGSTYIVGNTIDVSLTFDEPVTVTGTPFVNLVVGVNTRQADLITPAGAATTLVFRYTVVAGDSDADGVDVFADIQLNGGTIQDAVGNDAVLTFAQTHFVNAVVDGVVPTILSTTITPGTRDAAGANIDVVFVYSKPLTVTGTPFVDIDVGGTIRQANLVAPVGSTTTLTFHYTVQAGEVDADGVVLQADIQLNGGTIKDIAGNLAVTTFAQTAFPNVLVDGVAPVLQSVTVEQDPHTYTVGEVIKIFVQYDKNMAVTGTPTITLTIGATAIQATFTSVSNNVLTFSHTVAPGERDLDGLTVNSPITLAGTSTIKDVAGNNGPLTFTTNTFTNVFVNGGAAITTVAIAPGQYGLDQNQTVLVKITYDEAVTVTGVPQIALSVDQAAPAVPIVRMLNFVSQENSDKTLVFSYTVQVGDLDSNLTFNPATISGGTINNASLTGAQLNFSTKLTGATTGVTVDGVRPTVVFQQTNFNQVTGLASFTVNFNETVTGLTKANFKLTPIGKNNLTGFRIVSLTPSTGTGQQFTLTVFVGSGRGQMKIDFQNTTTVLDAALNVMTPPGSLTIGNLTVQNRHRVKR